MMSELEVIYPLRGKRVWVAGHRGMVGSAIVRRLERENCEIITVEKAKVDLTRQSEVLPWVKDTRPDAIVVAAARVGGILANAANPVPFLHENLMIESNLFEAAHAADVNRVLFLGSSCIYPRLADQPIREEALLTGPLEPTNEWYAVAKIAGIKLAQAYKKQFGRDYISAMPTNLYGPGDNFDLQSSHVLPALIRKAHEAKVQQKASMTIWGSGKPLREFLHCDDCADGLIFLLSRYSGYDHVNVGSDTDLSIMELAQLISSTVGFNGVIECDTSKPDGTPRKLMSSARLRAMGWAPRITLEEGLRSTYGWFLEHRANVVTAR